MPSDDSLIPRINLGQIGPPAGPGSVDGADTHHGSFVQYLQTGKGLDALLDGVDKDTVDRDGLTPAQRAHSAEQQRQHNVLSAGTRDPIRPVADRSGNRFFDDDIHPAVAADDGMPSMAIEKTEHPELPDGNNQGGTATPPPEPLGTDSDAGENSSHSVATEPRGDEDQDSQPAEDQPADGDTDADVTSLWGSTHGVEDGYPVGAVVSDPDPRPEPGPVAHWLASAYRRWWKPLLWWQKGAAVIAVASAAIWTGYALFSSPPPQAPQAAAPIVDNPPPPVPTDDVLAPSKTDSSCPARSTPAATAFDNDPATALVCVRAYGADLQTVTIGYDQPVVVTEVCIIPGFEHVDANGRNLWNEHRVVTVINWRIGGQQFTQNIDPQAHSGACLKIPALATSVITGTVFKTVPPPPIEGDNGPSVEDINSTFAISEITVFGHPAGGAK